MREKGETQIHRRVFWPTRGEPSGIDSLGLTVLGDEKMEVNSITRAQLEPQHHQRADSAFRNPWPSQ